MINLSEPTLGLAVALGAALVLIPGVLMIMRRRDPLGLCLSLLGSAVVTSLAGLAAVVARTPARPWFIIGTSLVYVIGMIQLNRLGWATRWGGDDRFALAGSVIIGLSSAVALFRAPVAWDARSIWFFHASWFADPSTVYTEVPRTAMFSHVDYPPLTASFGGFAWLLGEPLNDWIPQSATALLTLAAIGALSIILARGASSALGRASVAGATTFVVLTIIRGNGLDGYVDGLAAVLIAILALTAFRRHDPPLALIAAVALALVKNEGYAILVLVILPLYLVRRRSILPLIPGLGIGLIWAVAIRIPRPVLESWQPFNVLPWSPEFIARLDVIGRAILSDYMLTISTVFWVGAVLLVLATETSHHSRVVVGGMGAVAAALLLVIVVMYLATPHNTLPRDLDWHLLTSVDRLVLHPAMVLATGAIYGIVAAWGAPIVGSQSETPVASLQRH